MPKRRGRTRGEMGASAARARQATNKPLQAALRAKAAKRGGKPSTNDVLDAKITDAMAQSLERHDRRKRKVRKAVSAAFSHPMFKGRKKK